MRGKLITFEGGEGSGKSTQARLLADHLMHIGHTVILTREPGGSPLAEQLRRVILDPATPRHSALAEALLFSAARADHLDATIRPALERGDWVISDRFADSTRVYQGIAGGLDEATVETLERLVIGATMPALTFLLDIDPQVGLARARQRSAEAHIAAGGDGQQSPDGTGADGFEARGIAFHQRLRAGFLALAQRHPQRFAVIDAAGPMVALQADIRATLAERLGVA